MYAINTHEAIKSLISQGIKENQAEAFVKIIEESSESSAQNVATKNDIKLVRREIKIAMQTTIITMGMMLTVAVGIITWLDKVVS